jgi:hypothetical protein
MKNESCRGINNIRSDGEYYHDKRTPYPLVCDCVLFIKAAKAHFVTGDIDKVTINQILS